METEELTIESLRESRPDLVSAIHEEAFAAMGAQLDEIEERIQESATPPAPDPAAMDEQAAADALRIQEAEAAANDAVQAEFGELRGQVSALTEKTQRQDAAAIVAKELRGSSLQESGKALVERRFADAVATDAVQFTAVVQGEIQAIAEHETAVASTVRTPGVPKGTSVTDAAAGDFDPMKGVRKAAGIPEKKE